MSSDGHITLDIRGPRGGLSADKAREFVADIMSGAKTDYTKVILSTWALSEESATILAEAIERIPVVSAILADIIAGRPEAEGLAVYRALGAKLQHKKLLELDLSDNAVGPKGLEACKQLLGGQDKLQKLYFCNCGMSAEACRTLSDILLSKLPTSLTVLHFDNNMSGSGGAIAISDIIRASPELTDFRFTSSRGGSEGGVSIANQLQRGPKSLKKVNLADNIFSIAGSKAIATWLRYGRNIAQLAHLDISDIKMQDEGAQHVATALRHSQCREALTTLCMGSNEITVKATRAVVEILFSLPQLTVLTLEGNEFEDDGAVLLARGLYKLSEAATPTKLETLDVRECYFGDEGALAIATAAAKIASLKKISMADNEGVTKAGWAAVQKIIKEAGKELDTFAAIDEQDDGDADDVQGIIDSLEWDEELPEWSDAPVADLPPEDDLSALTAAIGDKLVL